MTVPFPSRLVILTDFASPRGGASSLAIAQAEAMAMRGLKVTVIAGDQHQSAPPGVDLVSLSGQRLLDAGALNAASRGIWDRNVSRQIAAWIAKFDDDQTIYHLHGLQQTLSPSALSPLATVAHRLVIHAHDYFLACPNGAYFDYQANSSCTREAMSAACVTRHCDKSSRAHKLWRVVRQAVQNRRIKAVSRDATLVLLRPEMAARLPEFGRTIALANPARAFGALSQKSAKSTFFYIGDLNRYKGIFILAEAARRADVPLIFIGDGQERAALRQKWPEHRITGWLDRPKIAAELSQALAVVAPSLGPEPFGLAPVEALLSQIPVILGAKMLIANEVAAAGAGIKIIPGSVESLTDALLLLKKEDALQQSMSMAATACGKSLSMTMDQWIDRLLSIYGNILSAQQDDSDIYAVAAQ